MAEPAKRIDPTSRPVDGAMPSKIVNADPERVYVLANPNDEYCGVPAMLEAGWEIERPRKDGPHFVGMRAVRESEAVTRHGQWLMSRPKAIHEAEYMSGQAQADGVMSRIKRPGGIDGVVGSAGNRPAHVQNEEFVENSRN